MNVVIIKWKTEYIRHRRLKGYSAHLCDFGGWGTHQRATHCAGKYVCKRINKCINPLTAGAVHIVLFQIFFIALTYQLLNLLKIKVTLIGNI